MRYSEQRETVFQILKETQSHPSADWVYDKVKSILPLVSLGTVYRNLGELEDLGVIKSFSMKGAIRYDGNVADHSHFICRKCNLMMDFQPKDISTSLHNGLPKNFIAESMEIQISGLCDNCKTHSKKRN
ncbi:MAG: transcriptional repressor [Candidatus Marinimicrobia bacterium]|nr:transcriptional repressor [Candidatus Neomarinimicrobiota bacterium]MBL7031094.1 transcriptional repressor [Candidatus Neomarinimicrobiota bacterium]